MNSLRESAANYIRFARENPALAGDANALARLEKALHENLDEGFVALTAPNSPWTWETRALLRGADTDTQRADFTFPFCVNVVGLRPTLTPIRPLVVVGGVALPIPTLDDVDVQIDINDSAFLTNSNGLTTAAGRGGNSFVTLSTIDIAVPRTMGIRMQGDSKPTLGFTFRWKQPPVAGVVLFQDAFLTMGIFAYPAGRGLGGQTSKGVRGT